MSKTPSKDIQDCYAQAAECRAQANLTADSAKRIRLLDMERRWLWLAQSYTFADRLNEFVADLKRPCPSVARLRLVAGRR
jgi:hypothetical protein